MNKKTLALLLCLSMLTVFGLTNVVPLGFCAVEIDLTLIYDLLPIIISLMVLGIVIKILRDLPKMISGGR